MEGKLVQDAGENYQYIKTIFENKIELTKIEAIEKFSGFMGSIVLIIFITLGITLFYVSLLILLGIYLTAFFQNSLLATVIVALFILLNVALTVMFREKLIYKGINNLIYKHFLN